MGAQSRSESLPRQDARAGYLRHAGLVIACYLGLWVFLHARLIFGDIYLASSDLSETFLPAFLAPFAIWSEYELAGFPLIIDSQLSTWYPLNLLFARVLGSWSGYVVSAYVLASCFCYAYAYHLTGSKTAAAIAGLAFGLCEALGEKYPHLATLHTYIWLPLILLAIERLAQSHSRLWFLVGALAVGCMTLAGNIQLLVYILYLCGAYILVCGFCQRLQLRFYLAAFLMFALGGLMAGIQVLPLAEALAFLERQVIAFDGFVSHSLTPVDLLAAMLSEVDHSGLNRPTYVGLGILVLAILAMARPRHNWRIGFFALVAVVSLLLAFGDATPVARLAYELPLYDKFRIVARHLFLFAFALSILAAFGIAAMEGREAGAGMVCVALLAIGACLAVSVAWVLMHPDVAAFENVSRALIRGSYYISTIPTQLILFAFLTMAALGFAWRPDHWIWKPALVAVVLIDLIGSQPEHLDHKGLQFSGLTKEELGPSVHTLRLRQELGETRQRLLPFEGSHRDPLAFGTFARKWQVPSAGGYGPFLIHHLHELGQIGTNGTIPAAVLGPEDRGLDLLAVRYLIVPREEFTPGDQIQEQGLVWDEQELGLAVGRPGCGENAPASMTLYPPSPTPVDGLALVADLGCAEYVEQGTAVGRLVLTGSDGTRIERSLRAGVDLSERYHGRLDVRPRVKHELAPVFKAYPDDEGGSSYNNLVRLDFAKPFRLQSLEMTNTIERGGINLRRISTVDSAGNSHPTSQLPLFLNDPERWRELRRVVTGRMTDRGSDKPEGDEREYIVFENFRALPRAWIVPSVRALPIRDIEEAVRLSRLPDGHTFDPTVLALVENDDGPGDLVYDGSAATVTVSEISGTRMALTASAPSGGFLVVSDLWYPGWTAQVDGEPVEIYRTNLALRGLSLPPGEHEVEMLFRPWSLYLGAALSLLALVLIGLTLRARWLWQPEVR